jgi:hypothetical protein
MDDLRAMQMRPILPDPFPAKLENLIARARAVSLIVDHIDAVPAQLPPLQSELARIMGEISRVKQVILSEKTAWETERSTGTAPEPVGPSDLDRLSADLEAKRAEARRLQGEVAAEHLRCEKLAKDVTKLEKMLG